MEVKEMKMDEEDGDKWIRMEMDEEDFRVRLELG